MAYVSMNLLFIIYYQLIFNFIGIGAFDSYSFYAPTSAVHQQTKQTRKKYDSTKIACGTRFELYWLTLHTVSIRCVCFIAEPADECHIISRI